MKNPLAIDAVFERVNNNTCKLYVPKGSLSAYSKAMGWSEFATIVEEE